MPLSITAQVIILGILCSFELVSTFEQKNFIIGAYSEPPINDEVEATYQQMAQAGFNMVIGGFSCNTSDTIVKQLQACSRYGIQALVGAYNAFDPQSPWPCQNYSSCLGFHVMDEPQISQFDWVAKAVQSAHNSAPNALAFVNLLPNNAVSNFTAYVGQFVEVVQPDILSFDSYPNFTPTDAEDGKQIYMANLEVIRTYALQAKIPFWNYLTSMSWDGVADPTATQISWQVMTSVVYGAKGVMYFCYWNPYRPDLFYSVGEQNSAIIRSDGTPSRHYAEVSQINSLLHSWGPTLMQLTSTSVSYIPTTTAPWNVLLPASMIQNLTVGFAYIVGSFAHTDGRSALILLNYWENNAILTTVVWNSSTFPQMVELDAEGNEIPLMDDTPLLPGFQLALNAGQARLFLSSHS